MALASQPDESIDQVVRRGQSAGGPWIIASVVAFVAAVASGSPSFAAWAVLVGFLLFVVGIAVRVRYWRRAHASYGGDAMQRGQWRRADREQESKTRIVAAIALPVLLVAYQLWR